MLHPCCSRQISSRWKFLRPGCCEPCSFWCDALHLLWDLSKKNQETWIQHHEIQHKIDRTPLSGFKKLGLPAVPWKISKKRFVACHGLSEELDNDDTGKLIIYVIWEFSEFGLKNACFFWRSSLTPLHHLIIRKNNVHLVARTHRLLIRMASWKSLANFPKLHTPLFHPLLLYSCKLARISTIHQETKAGKPLEDLITPMLQGAHWCYHKVWASRGEQVVEMLPTLTNCIENTTRFEVQELLHLEKLIWNKLELQL